MSASEERLRKLLLGGLAGDTRVYADFLRELSAHLRPYFRRRLARWPDDVEDLVQEALLAVHNQRHTYDAGLPVTAWVHAIARYKLIDRLRRRAGRDAATDAFDDDADWAGVDEQPAADARQDVAKLLARLPDRFRLPIQYVKVEGLTVAEAARKTGMSESAVKIGIHRGLKALAAHIRGEAERTMAITP